MNSGFGCSAWLIGIVVFICILCAIAGGGSSNSSSSYSYTPTYSREESYDAKYGKGSYAADKALYDSMKDAYNSAAGN